LVESAAGLLRRGVSPTVAEAAEEAKISRATAYRYFPTQESLLLEIATIAPMFGPVEDSLRAVADRDPLLRLQVLLGEMTRTVFGNEAHMRTALKAYMDQWLEARRRGQSPPPVVRVGRRMLYLDQILADLRTCLPAQRWRRLRGALALTMGPEALVVMKDVCRFSDREAADTLRWAAEAILQAGMRDAARENPSAYPKRSGRRN